MRICNLIKDVDDIHERIREIPFSRNKSNVLALSSPSPPLEIASALVIIPNERIFPTPTIFFSFPSRRLFAISIRNLFIFYFFSFFFLQKNIYSNTRCLTELKFGNGKEQINVGNVYWFSVCCFMRVNFEWIFKKKKEKIVLVICYCIISRWNCIGREELIMIG